MFKAKRQAGNFSEKTDHANLKPTFRQEASQEAGLLAGVSESNEKTQL